MLTSKPGQTQPLSDFLAALPPNTPQEVRDLLRMASEKKLAGLPPRLFVETVEQLPMAITITDTEARILFVNRAFGDVTGYQPDELIGRNQSILSNRATPAEVYENLWTTITAGDVWRGTLVNRRKSGDRYLAELTIVPVKDSRQRIAFYVGIQRDVTEVHRLEQAVRNQKALIESVVQAAPVAMVFLDPDGTAMLDNDAYKALMADLRGVEPAHRILAAVAEGQGRAVADIIAGKRDFANVEVRIDAVGGRETRWLSCSGNWVGEYDGAAESYFRHERRTGLLLVCNDVSRQRRRYEDARTAMVRTLMADQSRVNAVRETIAASIFHLQGPLNMVAAALGMLQRQGEGGGALALALGDVIGAGRKALDRLRAAMPMPLADGIELVNVNEVVRDVLDISTERFLVAGAVVNWRPTPVLPSVPGRGGALRAMVKHLLDNAVDALAESGSSNREIVLGTAITPDGMVEMTVEDSGPGVPDDERLTVFEPFHCGWRHRRGHAGMGLTIAQQAVLDQGGGIVLEPAAGGGCRVRVTLSTRIPRHVDA